MSRFIMKESPDSDYYIEWSTVVEAPVFAGSRREMLAHLGIDGEDPIARADATGTSVSHSSDSGWGGMGLLYMQRGLVPRSKIGELARRVMLDRNDFVQDLIEPFD